MAWSIYDPSPSTGGYTQVRSGGTKLRPDGGGFTQTYSSPGYTPPPGYGNPIPKPAPAPQPTQAQVASLPTTDWSNFAALPQNVQWGADPLDFNYTDPYAQAPQDPGAPNNNNYPGYTDPAVTQALAQEQMGNSQLDSGLKAARERAIINFGDPALADMAGFGLDPQAAAFARQNYLSGNATLARLDKAHGLSRQAVINKLAGHGLLFSGDTGYQTAEADQDYAHQTYDARQQLLDYLFNTFNQYQDRKSALRQGVLQTLQPNYQNFFASYS